MSCATGLDYLYTDVLYLSGFMLVFQTVVGGIVREISDLYSDIGVCAHLWKLDEHSVFRRQ